MKIFKFDSPCIIKKFKFHDQCKDDVIDAIEFDMSKRNLTSKTMNIMSDWGSGTTAKKLYWRYIEPHIVSHMEHIFIDTLGYDQVTYSNFWYQQYNKGGKHGWHVHTRTMFTSVYYLEYPEGSPKTEFMHPLSKEISSIDVEEGDILTFPSFIIHRAQENNTENRKTILSWHNEAIYDKSMSYG